METLQHCCDYFNSNYEVAMPAFPNKKKAFILLFRIVCCSPVANFFDRHDKLFRFKTLFKERKEVWFVKPSRLLFHTLSLRNTCLPTLLKAPGSHCWVYIGEGQSLRRLWMLSTGGLSQEPKAWMQAPGLLLVNCVTLSSVSISVTQRHSLPTS